MHGVSTRKVDDLMKALGLDGMSKSEVSRICAEPDTVVAAFRTRPLTGRHRYPRVAAPYPQLRAGGRVLGHGGRVSALTRARAPAFYTTPIALLGRKRPVM